MKITEVVATLAGLTAEQVGLIVEAVNGTRDANAAIAAVEPKKAKRGRKPGVKNTPKEAAKPAPKKSAKKSSKKSIPDSFTE